ncbi:MAG: trehalose-6-phosphate synthase [Candidatus Margulisiibacteriota bacterium]
MRLSVRFVLPLLLVLVAMAYAVVPLVDNLTLKWVSRDLTSRTHLIGSSVQDTLSTFLDEGSGSKINRLFDRMIQDERLYAIGFYGPDKRLLYKTKTFPDVPRLKGSILNQGNAGLVDYPQGLLHVSYQPLVSEGRLKGYLVLVHDMSFVQKRSVETKRYIFYLFLLLGCIISLVTVVVAQLSWRGWVKGIRTLIKGKGLVKPWGERPSVELSPIVKDIRTLIRNIDADRKARDEAQITWSPGALKEILHSEFAGDEILIVSNREPYIHTWEEGEIAVKLPASGLVTALEPVMRACSGTWIAHGGGDADRETVDQYDHVQVPPENPSYQIRRVWLSKEEEQGYYYGFSNEGLWPLCHMAHTRPIFRAQDWDHYVSVNQKFADAVFEEAKTKDPVVLVQDYHLALLPRMIKAKLPKATIITFWHIPWPNPESFGICPWRNEILEGLLGSSIIGFHTRFHCNNFIDTVDRFVECRIDQETSTISFGGELTAINHYPISIEWPPKAQGKTLSIEGCRQAIRVHNGFPADRRLGIGVERLDYTKGILERFMAVERFLEVYPEWIGRFTFVQIAAPSRSTIEQYQHLESQVRDLARKINHRFSLPGYVPICLKIEHHSQEQITTYFRGSDVCVVSSLHDGMNLVAKEFVAARDDNQGVLILSQFAGASRELPQALIVNPYNIDQCAAALKVSLDMSENEQRDRMRTMRGLIQEFNVYRWAGKMLIDAARIRQHNRFVGTFGSTKESLRAAQQ